MHGEVKLSGGGSVALVRVDGSELDIVNAARASFGKETVVLEPKDVRLLDFLGDEAHSTPVEMAGMVWVLTVPIFVARQIMRQRTFSWNELSRRYTDAGIAFWRPRIGTWRADGKGNKQVGDGALSLWRACGASVVYWSATVVSFVAFWLMRKLGVSKEQARAVTPVATMTRIVCHADLLNFCKFAVLRCAPDAQEETRELARAMCAQAEAMFPHVVSRWMARARVEQLVREAMRECRKSNLPLSQIAVSVTR